MKPVARSLLSVIIGLGFLSLSGQTPEDQFICISNDQCHDNECSIPDGRGGQKCIPKRTVVAVFASNCVQSVDYKDATVETLTDDQGKPELWTARIIGAAVNLKPNCEFHHETRSR